MKCIAWYNKHFEKRPLVTQLVSGFAVFGLGDYLSQIIENKYLNKSDKIKYKRILKNAVSGTVLTPYLHLQYCIIIPRLFPDHKKYALVKSVAYAVLISDCVFNLFYFILMSLINRDRNSPTSLHKEVMDKFVPTQILSMKIWPFLTTFNFYYLPMQFRVLFDNVAGIGWAWYLSYVENN